MAKKLLSKEERLKRAIEGAQLKAARVAEQLAEGTHPEAAQPWKDASNHVRASMILAQGVQAERRAIRHEQVAAPLAVILISERIEDGDAWEREAAKVMEGTVVDSLPAKKLLGGLGIHGQGAPGARTDLREEETQAQHQEAKEDKGA